MQVKVSSEHCGVLIYRILKTCGLSHQKLMFHVVKRQSEMDMYNQDGKRGRWRWNRDIGEIHWANGHMTNKKLEFEAWFL